MRDPYDVMVIVVTVTVAGLSQVALEGICSAWSGSDLFVHHFISSSTYSGREASVTHPCFIDKKVEARKNIHKLPKVNELFLKEPGVGERDRGWTPKP